MLHVNSLTVSAFRGIPSEVSINLTAPLTLLYAPNGTGKTTLCDAIEWLLTGEVERIASINDDLLGCQHSKENRTTFVQASIEADNRAIELQRDLGESRALVTVQGSPGRRCTPSEFFEYLAPHIATDFAVATSRFTRRREWIVGTHFLSSERLSRLMDSDEANREHRQDLFADLLGVGQLQRLATRFDKVLSAVEKQRDELRMAVTFQTSRVTELENQLKRTGAVVDFASTWSAIVQAASVQGIGDPIALGRQSGPDYHEAVRRIAERVEESKVQIDQLEPSWSTLLEWVAYDEVRTESRHSISETLADLTQQASDLASGLDHDRERLAKLASSLKDIMGQSHRLDVEINALRAAANPLERFAAEHNYGTLPLGQLVQIVLNVTPSSITNRAAIARSLKAGLVESIARNTRLQEARTRLSTMPPEQELATLYQLAQAKCLSAREREASLKRAWEALASVGHQIYVLGQEFAEHHAHTGRCPLCTHDWESADALKFAIKGATDAFAPAVGSAQAEYAAASSAFAEAERQAVAMKGALDARNSVTGVVRALEEQLEPFWLGCRQLGFAAQEIPDIKSIESVIRACASHEAAIVGAQSIREIQGNIAPANDGSEWALGLADAIRQRESSLVEAATTRASLDAESTALALGIAKGEEAVALLKARVAAVQREIASATEVQRRRDAAAQAVGLELPPTRVTIKNAHILWETKREQISQLTSLVRSLSSSLLAQTWRSQLEERKAEADAASKEARASSRRCDEVKSLQTLLLSGLDSAKRSRVDGLRAAVEALFLKMHAARIAEGVDATADAGSFAVRIGRWMSEAECLSQGQRQDLAIAIFLARARAYGGTFFLDEPLLHLDDLNRVALLDVLRAVAIQDDRRVRLVVTTASSIVFKHLLQKCRGITRGDGISILRAYELSGNVKDDVQAREVIEK